MDYINACATIVLSILTLWLFYRYLMKPYSYWEKLGVPSVPAVPIFGSVLGVATELTHERELENYMKYGRVHGYYEMRMPVLTVGDLNLLRDVLIKDFHIFPGARVFPRTNRIIENMLFMLQGEDWKRVRMIVSPVFSSGKIKKMFSIIMNSSKNLASSLTAEGKKAIDIKKYYGAFTMDLIASSAFGTKIDAHDPNNVFVKNAVTFFSGSVNWRVLLAVIFPSLMELLGISLFEPKSVSFFKRAVLSIIEERNKTGQKKNDFLQLLMDAEYDENDSITDTIDSRHIGSCDASGNRVFHKKHLSHDELIAQCVVFLTAGYETTSSTLAFASYYLALHPEWQEKIIEEVDECIKNNPIDGLTYDAVMNMKYLDMVVCETLRINPPGIRTERKANEDYTLGDLRIPKGQNITIPIYSIHHDPEYYPDPEKFDPNRFTAEEKAKRDQLAYLPFGNGPRSCLARRFALTEIKTCLAFLLSRFRFKKTPQTKIPLEYKRGQPMLQAESVTIEVEERKDAVVLD